MSLSPAKVGRLGLDRGRYIRGPARVKAKVLAPVRPNVGIELAYRRALMRLVDRMQADIDALLKPTYGMLAPAIVAQDAAPAVELAGLMRGLRRRWEANFDRAAPELAAYFAQAAQDRSSRTLSAILRRAGLTVQFRMTPAAQEVYDAAVIENVGLIRSIAQQHLQEVEGMVMRSAQHGRDLGPLAKSLRARYGITKRRAALIARDQNNKATAVITRVRQKELGITQARWVHSHAGKTPRPDHVAFSEGRGGGPYYDVEKGALISGERIFPGELINCRCVSRSVIPGFGV